ncbi:MFS transporter [Cryptosporangium minutisporangium]|uniref:Major facilitator superfamily (MFS) profile domain-containing protein n=1 Tax=Cryptosporangium minutisporangium TaxID=113569 RepID=A0ABP6SZT9_9ACTN
MSRATVTLGTSVTGAAIVAVDGSALALAQPDLRHDLAASYAQAQWVSGGYLLAVASLLIVAGRLGDRHGHYRLFAVGMLGFAATSAAISVAPTVEAVIALRVAQGVCGALLQPATLGMLRVAYPPDRLPSAIGARAAAIGVASALGPLLGGALTAAVGWRAIFVLTAVPALLAGLLALRWVEPAGPSGPDCGRGTPPAAFATRPVVTAISVLVAASATMLGVLFVGSFYLQDVVGLKAFDSALRGLPLAAAVAAAAPLAPRLARRVGARTTVAGALTMATTGALVLATLPAVRPPSGWVLTGAFILLGAGFGTVLVVATAVLVTSVPVAGAGVAGGVQQTTMNVGSALGVAVAAGALTVAGPTGVAFVVVAVPTLLGALLAVGLPRTGLSTTGRNHGAASGQIRRV